MFNILGLSVRIPRLSGVLRFSLSNHLLSGNKETSQNEDNLSLGCNKRHMM